MFDSETNKLAFMMSSIEAQGGRDEHHLPKLLALVDLPYLWSHGGELWIHRDDLIEDGRIGHER